MGVRFWALSSIYISDGVWLWWTTAIIYSQCCIEGDTRRPLPALGCRARENNKIILLYMFFWVFPRRQIVLPTFRNPLSGPSSKVRCGVWSVNGERKAWYLYIPCQGFLEQTEVPKRQQNTIWRRRNTQKNIYKIQNTEKIWNQELSFSTFL
jgi:hypothetical protein